ncbi:VOC family protein [Oscillochloris sp. ZM17-4]|uniref:VOC family protein n=1 Tax=Oscillochloris sp. ZM17-4 TaxID=2866714 RepID=UPI001C739FC9|nr:VOC family protein [Oscillochloris sp. ZM17-4]MBX0328477.1 VOC family protein [Oscillochloris sp. ZM17-4]
MAIQPDMIGIVVSDMAAALRFYRMLGLSVPEGVEGEAHVEVITPNGYRIAWDTEALMRSINPAWAAPTGSRVGLAFKCDGPADVDARYAQITAAGYAGVKEPWDAFWGQRYAQVADPDGLHIDLFAAM